MGLHQHMHIDPTLPYELLALESALAGVSSDCRCNRAG